MEKKKLKAISITVPVGVDNREIAGAILNLFKKWGTQAHLIGYGGGSTENFTMSFGFDEKIIISSDRRKQIFKALPLAGKLKEFKSVTEVNPNY